MKNLLSQFHRMTRWLGPILGVALLCVSAVQAVHHHGEGEAHHLCVVCTASHMPAVEAAASPTGAGVALCVRRVVVAPELARVRTGSLPHLGRGPPQA